MKRFILLFLVLSLLPGFALCDSTDNTLASQDILLMENTLYCLGYAPGAIDGSQDEETEASLTEFQRDHALPTTGAADTGTIDALIRAAYAITDDTQRNSFANRDSSIPVYSMIGLRGGVYADNGIRTYEAAYGNGIRNVAVNVFLTSDGQLICSTNPIGVSADRMTKEALCNTYHEVVPLGDLVSLYGEGASFLVTVSDTACAQACAQFFLGSETDVVYASAFPHCLTAISRVRADARLALIADAIGFVPDLAEKAKSCGTTLILTGPGGITSSTTANMQYMGLTYAVQNITNANQAAHVMELGAQFIVSPDYRDILLLLPDPDIVCSAKQIMQDIGMYAGAVSSFPDGSFLSAYEQFLEVYKLDLTEGLNEKTLSAMREAAAETLRLQREYAGRPVLLYGNRVTSVVAHRGLTDGGAPENSMEAFQAALDAGVEWVELDILKTADDELVCHHDRYFIMRSKHYFVKSLTLSQIRHLYRKQTVPTLSEALALFRNTGIFVIVDMKGPDSGADAAKAVMELDMLDQVVFSASNTDYLRAVRSVCPTARLAFATGAEVNVKKLVSEGILDMILVHGSHASRDVIRELHDAGFQVAVWTINQENSARRYASYGADLLLTDQVSLFID